MTAPPKRSPSGQLWWAVAGIFLVVALCCLGVIWAGAAHDGDGNPLIDSPGAVLVGLLATVGTLGSAAIAKLGPAVSAIKENVQNDHKNPDGTPLYLRDDLDGKHEEILARQDAKHEEIIRRQDAMQQVFLDALNEHRAEIRADLGGLRAENRDDRRAAIDRERATADRFDSIEDRLSAATNRIHIIEQKDRP